MLEEYFQYLGVRNTGRGARLLGYAHEAAALQVRHRRCREAWRTHLEATQTSLLAAAGSLASSGGTALIVGGGIAQDLPLEQLLTHFERIVLLDIAFVYSTRRLAARWPGRVSCCLHDVTGIVDWLAQHRKAPPPSLLNELKLPDLAPRPNWVASVNCLTQLPLLPIDWLHDCGIADDILESFGQALIQAHLDWLSAWRAPICLITEIEDQRLNRNGTIDDLTDYRPLLRQFLEDANRLDGWTWHLNPPGELANGTSEIRIVEAYSKS